MTRHAMTPTAAVATAARNLLNVAETAAKLGVSARTVWRLRDRGTMPPPIKLGGSVRWDNAVLDAWIAAGCKAPARTR